MSRSKAPPAETIAGRYRVTARIASGGMGEVLRALDTVLGRTVAIKVLPLDLAARPGSVERFRVEAQAAAQLSHPNIVSIHDWGETGSTYYMVMEYVRGKNLRDVLTARGRLPVRQTGELMLEVLDALATAHERGIVHRDIKPENVMITVDGRVKVADFGLARVVERNTATGGLLGTVAYVAPEQARGEAVDGRADIYSAGCVMYELLTGAIPFEGDAARILYQHLNARVPAPSMQHPGIPEVADRIVLRATEPEPAERYASAAEMQTQIRSAMPALDEAPPLKELAGELTSEMPAEILETMVPVERRKPRWGRRLVIALLAVAAAAAGWIYRPARVPELVGLEVPAAKARLAAAGLNAEIQPATSDEPPNTVISTDPDRRSIILRGGTVVLMVSRGPALADLVDLKGKSLEEARKIVEEAGLLPGDVVERHDPAPQGTVIDQDPRPGRIRKGTPVNLTVSAGPEMVDVPALAGKPFEEAEAALRQAGLEPVREDVFNDAPEGMVIDQTPKAGEKAAKGSRVRLSVSKGPEPFAMPDVRGKACSTAKSELESLGLVVSVNSQKGGCAANKVLEQDPLPGAMVRRGQEVTLYVA